MFFFNDIQENANINAWQYSELCLDDASALCSLLQFKRDNESNVDNYGLGSDSRIAHVKTLFRLYLFILFNFFFFEQLVVTRGIVCRQREATFDNTFRPDCYCTCICDLYDTMPCFLHYLYRIKIESYQLKNNFLLTTYKNGQQIIEILHTNYVKLLFIFLLKSL